jgi:hypothetical protein
MATFILFLAFLCAGSALVFDNAGYMAIYGFPWARDACYAAWVLCQSSKLEMYAAAGLTGVWAVLRTVSIMRD